MMAPWVTFGEEKNANESRKRLHRKVGDSDTCGDLATFLSEKVAFRKWAKKEIRKSGVQWRQLEQWMCN